MIGERSCTNVAAARSRADLVRVLVNLGPDALNRQAPLFGFERSTADIDRHLALSAPRHPVIIPNEVPVPLSDAAEPQVPALFWRLERVEYVERSGIASADATVLTDADFLSWSAGQTPRHAPLIPWPRLWPVLRQVLDVNRPRGLDVAQLVRRWSRAECVMALPQRNRRDWTNRVLILIDRNERLMPFWQDQNDLVAAMPRVCGANAVVTRVLWDGADELARRGLRDRRNARVSRRVSVLALSDLGFYGAPAQRDAWRRLARLLRRAGHAFAALVPCPPSRWETDIATAWRAVLWDRVGPGGLENTQRLDISPVESTSPRERNTETLLTLLCAATRVEPGLLRAVRMLLGPFGADVGTEADAWNHSGVDGSWSGALAISETFARRLRTHLSRVPLSLRLDAARLIREWHRILPPEVQHEEGLVLDLLGLGAVVSGEERRAARLFIERLVRTLDVATPRMRAGITSWFLRSERRLPDSAWWQHELAAVLGALRAHAHAEVVTAVDATIPSNVQAAAVTRSFQLRQIDSTLVAFPTDATLTVAIHPGSHLADIQATRSVMFLDYDHSSSSLALQLDRAYPSGVPLLRGTPFSVQTDCQYARFGVVGRPDWATAVGRDAFGLWSDIVLAGVKQRMRWIPPGRFRMGSPSSEAGRREDEGPQHQMTLTGGFWLADTPCTQEIWTAVMGENPSRFVSRTRPVENVSWNDCHTFLQMIEEQGNALVLRLPTEAEWEYACRGGTTMSSYAGEVEMRGQRNAPVLDAIAWYGGNSGMDFELDYGEDTSAWLEKHHDQARAGSHPVAQKEPNAWGLYDTLGNVWEWCADHPRTYTAEAAIEAPRAIDNATRVIRGGSWSDRAWYVRAAARYRFGPAYRSSRVGLRVAADEGSSEKLWNAK